MARLRGRAQQRRRGDRRRGGVRRLPPPERHGLGGGRRCQIRPITGRYLFVEGGERHWAVMDPRVGKQLNEDRPVYTPELLVRALREGHRQRRPRAQRDDAALRARRGRRAGAAGHLERLSVQWSPGVTADTIHLASVIAPGADLERRAVFVQMMEAAVRQKNMNTVGGRRVQGRRNMVSPAEHMQQTERQWTLDIWRLEATRRHGARSWPRARPSAPRLRSSPAWARASGASACVLRDAARAVLVPEHRPAASRARPLRAVLPPL